MSTIDETAPRQPVGAIAPGTHPLEQQRLALQERTHPDCDPLQVQVVIWLLRAYSAAIGTQADELRPLGLSPSGFNVLMALHNTPGRTLEPFELAERLLVSRPSVTGLLDTLQAKGLIRREPHPDDRRRVNVVLTEEAADLLARHFPTHYARQRALLGGLSAEEMAQLIGLLRKISGATPPHLQLPDDEEPR